MQRYFYWAIVLLAIFPGRAIAQSLSDSSGAPKPYFGTYSKLNLPALSAAKVNGTITIAVIDDGFNLNHTAIKNYLYKNTMEIPGNNADDDGNGFIDDVTGFDVADNDNNTSLPQGRESYFYHGTMTAGTITQIAERCFGSKAAEYIKILPVKTMGDKSQKPYMENAYEGIDYAVKQKADIIVCAWNGGQYDAEKYGQIFDRAQQQGILILASAGNFYSEKCDPPASIASIYVVAGLDTSLRKLPISNYGAKVDLSAFGEFVYAPLPLKDNTFSYNDGSSAAVAQVTGCAAVLKVLYKSASSALIMQALKNTATPLDSINRYYAGKLGAGLPDLAEAVKYLLPKANRNAFFNPQRPEGEIVLDKTATATEWLINPQGDYKGFTFSLNGNWKAGNKPFNFYVADTLAGSYLPGQFPVQLVINGSSVKVEFTGKKGTTASTLVYSSIPIDSTTLYCSNTRYFENAQGDFTDGSGPAEYANNCDCKWQIKVPAGKRIKLEFDEFNTQAKTDFVWVFEGTGTLQENILAKFSGPDLPPVVVSGSNEVLVWFVTDKTVTAPGWHVRYTATDEDAGIKPPLKR